MYLRGADEYSWALQLKEREITSSTLQFPCPAPRAH